MALIDAEFEEERGDMDAKAHVGVIGAGIAGLVTAKVLKADGFHVTVFDNASEIGGTWTKANTYPGLRTNNSKRTYEFSDLPYPDEVADHPSHEEVRSYLNSYADKFGLLDNIRLGKEVVAVERHGQSFALTLRDGHNEVAQESASVDRLVVCNGIFHQPILPDLPGCNEFDGAILHSSQVDESTFADEGVLAVVGGGKSAYDIAEEAARSGLDVTLIVRSPQWRAPRYGPDGEPGDYGLYIRELHQLMPFYADSEAELAAKSKLESACNAIWKDFSEQFAEALGIPASLRPDKDLPVGLPHLAAGGDLYELVRDGRVKIERAGVAELTPDGLTTDSGRFVPANKIVFGTGWQRDYGFLSDELAAQLIDASDRLALYRNVIPPGVNGLAFNGHASSFSCTLTAEIGAHWISEYFLGRIDLPAEAEMWGEIARYRNWADRWLASRPCDSFVGPFHIPHVLLLLNEITGGEQVIASFGDNPRKPLLPSLFGDITEYRNNGCVGQT